MRNTTNCRRLDSNEDYFSTNPLSVHHHHHHQTFNKSLASLDIICEGGSALNSLQHAGSDDHDCMQTCLQHSLHLKSLVEDYLEPSSAHSTSHSQPNLFHSKYCPHTDTPYKDDKSFIHELQTIMLQNGGDDHVELITREVMRATEKEEMSILMHSDSAHGTPLSTLVVLGHLRNKGYNAGICTSKRDKDHHKSQHKGHNFPTEEYEYMDVILEKGSNSQVHQRLIIDLRFRSAFEIARPSSAYVELLKVVPRTYVGRPRVLQKILKLLSEAMENSFTSQGMPLPPWRKVSFLTSKWLSPTYSRSIFASPPPHTPPIPTTQMSSSNSISIKREKTLSTISTKREKALSTISTKRDTFSSISTKSEKALYSISTHKETLPKRETFSPISIKKENALSPISAKRETLSPISSKRENALSSTNMPSFSILSKRENSLFFINNLAPTIATKPILLKHVLKSFNLSTHILPSSNSIVKNNSNKKLTNQNVKPPRESCQLPPLSNPSTSNQNVKPPSREPWQLSPLPNPPPSVKKPKQLVGALTSALHRGSNSNSTTMSGSFNNLQFSLST